MRVHLPSAIIVGWAGMLAVGCTWLNTTVALCLVLVAVAVGLTAVFER